MPRTARGREVSWATGSITIKIILFTTFCIVSTLSAGPASLNGTGLLGGGSCDAPLQYELVPKENGTYEAVLRILNDGTGPLGKGDLVWALSSSTSTLSIESAEGSSLQDGKEARWQGFPSGPVNVTRVELSNNDSIASGDYMDMRLLFTLVPRVFQGIPAVQQEVVTFLGVQVRGMSCERQLSQSSFGSGPGNASSNITFVAETCPSRGSSVDNEFSADSQEAQVLTLESQGGQESNNSSACTFEYCCSALRGQFGTAGPAAAPAPNGGDAGVLLIANAPEAETPRLGVSPSALLDESMTEAPNALPLPPLAPASAPIISAIGLFPDTSSPSLAPAPGPAMSSIAPAGSAIAPALSAPTTAPALSAPALSPINNLAPIPAASPVPSPVAGPSPGVPVNPQAVVLAPSQAPSLLPIPPPPPRSAPGPTWATPGVNEKMRAPADAPGGTVEAQQGADAAGADAPAIDAPPPPPPPSPPPNSVPSGPPPPPQVGVAASGSSVNITQVIIIIAVVVGSAISLLTAYTVWKLRHAHVAHGAVHSIPKPSTDPGRPPLAPARSFSDPAPFAAPQNLNSAHASPNLDTAAEMAANPRPKLAALAIPPNSLRFANAQAGPLLPMFAAYKRGDSGDLSSAATVSPSPQESPVTVLPTRGGNLGLERRWTWQCTSAGEGANAAVTPAPSGAGVGKPWILQGEPSAQTPPWGELSPWHPKSAGQTPPAGEGRQAYMDNDKCGKHWRSSTGKSPFQSPWPARMTLQSLLGHATAPPVLQLARHRAARGNLDLIRADSARSEACLDIDFAKEVLLEDKIGSGAFGTVYRGRWQGEVVAVKIMQGPHPGGSAAELESFRQEVRILSGLQHDRIICLRGACLAPPHICIVEELAEGGSLYDRLHAKPRAPRRRQSLSYSELLQIAIDVADALAYLHACAPMVVHRDLKSQNVLLDEHGRAKVCDFGIAKFKNKTFISTVNPQAGTPTYMAPELFEGQRVTEKVDQYSFGMLVWEMLTNDVPWASLSTPMQVIYIVGVQKRRPDIPEDCPPTLRALIADCWHDDPDQRPPFDHIVRVLQVTLDGQQHLSQKTPVWAERSRPATREAPEDHILA